MAYQVDIICRELNIIPHGDPVGNEMRALEKARKWRWRELNIIPHGDPVGNEMRALEKARKWRWRESNPRPKDSTLENLRA